jgi:selenocysteine lyase/cysteine desulfurase
MGYPNQAHIRVSLSFNTNKDDIDDFVVALTQTLNEI